MEELEEEQQEFVWTRCLHDQMFVFQEHDLDRILDIVPERPNAPGAQPVHRHS